MLQPKSNYILYTKLVYTCRNEDAGTDVVSTQVILNRVSQTNINVQFNFTTKQVNLYPYHRIVVSGT